MVEADQKRSKRYEYHRQYRAKNRDKFNERRREWRKRPDVIAKEKAYAQRPEVKTRRREAARIRSKTPEFKAYQKEWNLQNRERRLIKSREYNSRPEVKERNRRNYLLRKYGVASLAVLKRDNYICRKCGSTKRISIHHVDWNEENNCESNLIVLCSSCHSSVHFFMPERLRQPIFEEWLTGITSG